MTTSKKTIKNTVQNTPKNIEQIEQVELLQRTIVNGLEDVKAQNIQVFDTEHLSPLFERVIVASGTSNRQTKALASSVRDALREAGLNKPRTEGEENGEWIIVDCGSVVLHIMQPVIRQYYHLEELWGEKPIDLKSILLQTKKPFSRQNKNKENPEINTQENTETQEKQMASTSAKKATKKVASSKSSSAVSGQLLTENKADRKPAARKTVARKSASKETDSTSTKPQFATAKKAVRKTTSSRAKPAPVQIVKVGLKATRKTSAKKSS